MFTIYNIIFCKEENVDGAKEHWISLLASPFRRIVIEIILRCHPVVILIGPYR